VESIDPKAALKVLSKLMWHPMDLETLKSTKIGSELTSTLATTIRGLNPLYPGYDMMISDTLLTGVTVNAYKKSAHSKVARYAKELVSKWKKLMGAP